MATSVYWWFRIIPTTTLSGCLALCFLGLFISNAVYLSILVVVQLVLLFIGMLSLWSRHKQDLAVTKYTLARVHVNNTGKRK